MKMKEILREWKIYEEKVDDEFDPEALEVGTKVEMEHTDDPEEARGIAKDHLRENPLYYEKLAKVEKSV